MVINLFAECEEVSSPRKKHYRPLTEAKEMVWLYQELEKTTAAR